jgi:predicted Zn-dependent protease
VSGIAIVFYDGRRSAPAAARLMLDTAGQAHVDLPDGRRSYVTAELRIGDRVGLRSPRLIEFPDGALAHVDPDPQADAWLDAASGRGSGWVRRMEARWPAAIAALAVSALAVFAFLRWGLPGLAQAAAARVPPAMERRIGERAMQEIDEQWFGRSTLEPRRQSALREAFERRVAARAANPDLRLEFRAGGDAGPNAFALPGGIIVVTDELVEAARHDDEVMMVLAHEVGHVVHRHTMRQVFESLGLTAVLTTLTGDLSGPASLAAALPAVLTQAAFSRRDEREADAHAFAWSDAEGVPRTRMTDLLERIERETGGGGWPTYLSTHPSSAERAAAARAPR